MAAEGRSYPEILTALNDMERQEKNRRRLAPKTREIHAAERGVPGRLLLPRQGLPHARTSGGEPGLSGQILEPLVSRAMFERVQRMLDGSFLISYLPMTEDKRRIMQDDSWKPGA